MKLTRNFSSEEFACPCCGEARISRRLVKKLQILRDLVGHPVMVLKGYSCSDPVFSHGVSCEICSGVSVGELAKWSKALGIFNEVIERDNSLYLRIG